MKPLDLSVSIQNSYEAARSESVRLEKPHVIGQLANEDAQRDQLVRDQSVVAPEAREAGNDLFAADEYEHSDYTERSGGGLGKRKRREGARQKPEQEKKIAEEAVQPEKKEGEGGFSTYA